MSFTSILLSFLVGTGAGILLQRFVFSRGSKVAEMEQELLDLKTEQLQLKESLNHHFSDTAHLTNNLTQSYKALYDHLAQGAQTFNQMPLSDLKQLLEQEQHTAIEEPKDYPHDAGIEDPDLEAFIGRHYPEKEPH